MRLSRCGWLLCPLESGQVAQSLALVASQDGDQLHPQSNVDKMSSGHPLTDEVWHSVAFREETKQLNFNLASTHSGPLAVAPADQRVGHRHAGERRTGPAVECGRDRLLFAQKDLPRFLERLHSPNHLYLPLSGSVPHSRRCCCRRLMRFAVWGLAVEGSRKTLSDRMGDRSGHFFKVGCSVVRTSKTGLTGVLCASWTCSIRSWTRLNHQQARKVGGRLSDQLCHKS